MEVNEGGYTLRGYTLGPQIWDLVIHSLAGGLRGGYTLGGYTLRPRISDLVIHSLAGGQRGFYTLGGYTLGVCFLSGAYTLGGLLPGSLFTGLPILDPTNHSPVPKEKI